MALSQPARLRCVLLFRTLRLVSNHSSVCFMKPQMKTDGWFLQVVTLPRAGWIGTWKWGASLWTGDIGSTLPILADAVKTILSAQATGFAWMTIDGGGYCGGDSQSPAYRETQLRWMQLSATLPIMRHHAAEDAFFEPFLF